MRTALSVLIAIGLIVPLVEARAQAQMDHHQHHQMLTAPAPAQGAEPPRAPGDHSSHSPALGPAGRTYDLRWVDGMVQHHTGALRMSEFVFGIGVPGVGSLGRTIWREQAEEIKAMRQWRKAWYPEAPIYPVALKPGGNPDATGDLVRMSTAQIQAMLMMGSPPTRENRVNWFLEGMLQHHGNALIMAHDALNKSANPTIKRLARDIIVAQRQEIMQIRKMLQHDGRNKPEYFLYDALFSLH